MNEEELNNFRKAMVEKNIEIAALREVIFTARDLLRTGSIPDALNMMPDEWAEYKCRRAAAILSKALEA